jgi:Fe-S cluster assembly iron-binding protein IscA
MLTTSYIAAEKLKEQLVSKLREVGIGFRVNINADESGKLIFSIKLDRQRKGDKVIESDGIKIFLDPTSAPQVEGYKLDYQDEPRGGFFLSTVQEVKGG